MPARVLLVAVCPVLTAVACARPAGNDDVGGDGDAPITCPTDAEQAAVPTVQIDAGIACDEESADIVLFAATQPGSRLTPRAPLHPGLALALVDDAWRLRGAPAAVADTADASFDADYVIDFRGCTVHTPIRVALRLDACDGSRASCDAGVDAFPIRAAGLPARIDADAAFSVSIAPDACLGSSCHAARPAACSVSVAGDRVTVGGAACVEELSVGCTFDCGGGAGAPCEIPPLAAGRYTLVTAGGEIAFDVPRDAAP